MYNIDQNVYVKGIVTGISKEDDGNFEYKIKIESARYRNETITVKADQIKLAAITMDELD